MQITASYYNYLSMTNLLAPLGVSNSSNLVMQVFSSALENLQDKIDNQTFTEESQAALNQLYSDVSALASAAKKLTLDNYNSVFNDRTASSSDTGVLTAEAKDAFSADSGATEATYAISVTQLAQAQKNTGLDLEQYAASTVGTGTNTFKVTINGETHELAVAVEDGDTNEEVLQKIALAINEADIGISADVADGSEEGTSRLTITSNNTGAESAFTLEDVSGNAITATGADSVSRTAQDAEFSVDGVSATSNSNTIYLDEGLVTVTLKGTGDAIVEISPSEDTVEDAITAFVSTLNSFIEHLDENSDYITDDVLSTINSFINDNKTRLESIGITQDEDGTLVIDEDQLSAAMSEDMGTIEDVFGGLDGLAVRVTNYASQVSTNSPLNYAKEAESVSTEFADYIYSASAELLQEALVGSLLNTMA